MKIGWKAMVALSVAIIVIGSIAISYLLDPSVFSFIPTSGVDSTNKSVSSQPITVSQSGARTRVDNEVSTTATATYCNCTDTESQG